MSRPAFLLPDDKLVGETPRITPKLLYGITAPIRTIEEAERDIALERAKWRKS